MKKQISLLFLLLSIIGNINAMQRGGKKAKLASPPASTAPQKATKFLVSKERYNTLLARYEDKINEIAKLKNRLAATPENSEDAVICQNDLAACHKEQDEIKVELVGCSQERDQLRADLDAIAERQFDNIQTDVVRNIADVFQQDLNNERQRANGLQNDRNKWHDKANALERDHRAAQSLLNTKNQELERAKKKLSNAHASEHTPYLYGAAIAGVPYVALSYTGSGKKFPKLHQALGDAGLLQSAKALTATHGGDLHNRVSLRTSTEIDKLGNGVYAGFANASGEAGNSLILQWVWSKLAARNEGNNVFAATEKKVPKPIKDIARLVTVHTCWQWEKNNLFFKDKFTIEQV